MAGAFHGAGRTGMRHQRGRIRSRAWCGRHWPSVRDGDLTEIADIIKKTAFKITRMGQLVAQEASPAAGRAFWYCRSLAGADPGGRRLAWPIFSRKWAWSSAVRHGTTAALALLNDAVKKGGVMASSHVGGLSGAFIPVSEDAGMIAAARIRLLSPWKSWKP